MMKTAKNLYPRIYTWENLELAYRRARRGKRRYEAVADFEFNWESQLLRLQEELAGQSYQPGPYHSFYIHDPKWRLISAAPFRDRVVHHALCHVIEPIFERRFIHDSYANRVGKGTHRALDRCTFFARRYPYVLQCDIIFRISCGLPHFLPRRQCHGSVVRRVRGRGLRNGAACPDREFVPRSGSRRRHPAGTPGQVSD